MRTLRQTRTSPISRSRVVATAVAGLALLCLTGAPPPVELAGGTEPATASAQRSATDEFSIARVLGSTNRQLAEPELARIARAVLRYSAKYELDPELVTAVILVESSALPGARSPKGAMGLMQVMPAMLEPLRLVGNFTTVESNIEAGCLILADNIRRMGEADGILAYFWGPNIRGDAYLERVRAARAEVRRQLRS
ncbi:MAG: transglycosylase [Deltaproteobacteria bacterium]|nr:transglycosylase [Deltaproteobacteria bacterium]